MFPSLVWTEEVHPPSCAEREGEAARQVQRGGAGQDDQVRHGEGGPELLLDRLQEVQGGLEVLVNGPVLAWREPGDRDVSQENMS